MTNVIFTVGNDMRADDGAGPLLAALLDAEPAPGWEVIDGGASPENHIHQVRACNPDRVLIVDAADMQLPPGAIRLLDEDCVADHFLITTHAIPLNFLIASLRETIPEIVFLGIQPQDVVFLGMMTPGVRLGVEALHRKLVQGGGINDYAPIGEDMALAL
ncbi:MAG TPA: hydrogenase maturation peptidase HycI [Telmatospirillum sp.]|nr:hydrogenase maturation peptidase HycI [Telmatospirillum sp.]